MFMGEFNHSIDAKGRMIMPAKIREQLGDKCIITMGLDDCLFVYDEEKWNSIVTTLNKQPTTKASIRALKRMIFGKATESEFDGQGRVLIPTTLRQHAGLDKKSVVVGAGDHVEIWSQEKWNTYMGDVGPKVEELVETIEDLTF